MAQSEKSKHPPQPQSSNHKAVEQEHPKLSMKMLYLVTETLKQENRALSERITELERLWNEREAFRQAAQSQMEAAACLEIAPCAPQQEPPELAFPDKPAQVPEAAAVPDAAMSLKPVDAAAAGRTGIVLQAAASPWETEAFAMPPEPLREPLLSGASGMARQPDIPEMEAGWEPRSVRHPKKPRTKLWWLGLVGNLIPFVYKN